MSTTVTMKAAGGGLVAAVGGRAIDGCCPEGQIANRKPARKSQPDWYPRVGCRRSKGYDCSRRAGCFGGDVGRQMQNRRRGLWQGEVRHRHIVIRDTLRTVGIIAEDLREIRIVAGNREATELSQAWSGSQSRDPAPDGCR